MSNNNHFLIIATGWNCEQYVNDCIMSIQDQTYKNWHAVFVSDGSTDSTARELAASKTINCAAQIFETNAGACKRRMDAIKTFSKSDNDIIILLGLDDRLLPNALERINKEYEYNSKWMTYGNWIDNKGSRPLKELELMFSEDVHASRSYRNVRYRSTAPNTFRRFLFDQLNDDDFKYNGDYFRCTTESHWMFPFLEMCGKKRIGVISDAIYVYNKRGQDSTRLRIGADEQQRVYDDVIKRRKKQLLIR